jgi:outer membrane PBP1 activator LpoA protein
MPKRLTLAAALVLTGCALFEPPPSPLDSVLGEAVQAARAPAPEQKVALQRAEQAYKASPTSLNRLRLATLLATLPDPLRDDARAAELLEPIADASDPGAGRFAALLAAQIGERRRAAREAERLARERERADKERDKREEALKQQLDALRGIERGILEREERLRRRPN